MNLDKLFGWCRRHLLATTSIGIVAVYFAAYRIYYCLNEGCTHPADWWFHLPAEGQAAWIGSLGTLVAVWWGFVLFWHDRRVKREVQRKTAQPVVYPLISKIEALEGRFNNIGLLHPEIISILEISAKHGKLKQELVAVDASFALLQDDEIASLVQLNQALTNLNECASRCGTDLNYGGSTGADLLILAKKAHERIGEALSLLRSRYVVAIRKPRILEPSDSDDEDKSGGKP